MTSLSQFRPQVAALSTLLINSFSVRWGRKTICTMFVFTCLYWVSLNRSFLLWVNYDFSCVCVTVGWGDKGIRTAVNVQCFVEPSSHPGLEWLIGRTGTIPGGPAWLLGREGRCSIINFFILGQCSIIYLFYLFFFFGPVFSHGTEWVGFYLCAVTAIPGPSFFFFFFADLAWRNTSVHTAPCQ